ncbi:thiamine ABC transporter ATP-binding protein [Tessaracoccus aquimaris]|uniref:Thiamine ABC transporter ATP-binding protein n=1 Tax=Tessaracoccus aquimaris TaxID=1332264 RepID=A0A1Q2CMJ3_9ACTN|nr:carbohydrate ABC transporter permease [Tessaracoccus aquimaris]AQP47316.1 thiamine ABC transporter ATP-binding protein [Tessaracoccus aquimaris]
MARRSKNGYEWGSPFIYLVAAILISACLTPVIFIIVGAFRTNSELTTDPAGWPSQWQFSNYTNVLSTSLFWQQAGNSLIVALWTTLGVVLIGLMAAYVVARYQFRGRGALYALYASGLMFPLTVAITPLYLLIRSLKLVDTLPGVIIPQIAFGLPMTIIILVPFLRAIPKEIEEAAAIDGCSRLDFFWRIALRLSVPGLVTTGILAFVGSWNGYMLPLFVLNNPSLYTLPLGTQAFSSEHSVDTAAVLAFTSLSMLPALAFFSLFERRIVGGLTGAVKG